MQTKTTEVIHILFNVSRCPEEAARTRPQCCLQSIQQSTTVQIVQSDSITVYHLLRVTLTTLQLQHCQIMRGPGSGWKMKWRILVHLSIEAAYFRIVVSIEKSLFRFR